MCGGTFKDTTMRRKMQAQDEEKILVGMDAHSEKLELCVARWTHGSDPVRCKSTTTTVDALESTYLKQVPQGSLTLIEASQNTFSIVERLRRIGYEAKVLNSDVLKGMARRDRINDRIDAENLAKAYARGHGREVHVPGEKHREYRDVLFGYFSATKDALRSWNRVWGFCSAHGMKLPKGGRLNAAKNVESALKDATLTETQRFVGNMDVEQFKSALELKGRFQRQIELTVSKDKDMQALMQILGFRFIVSFALVAFVEDVRRFPTPSKLVAYVGLNPRMNSSGKDEGGNAMTSCGIPRLKALVTEAAQISLRRGDAPMHRWARRKLAEGKPYNKVIGALARKMVVYAWHVLMGHPAPNCEMEASFTKKLELLGTRIGRDELRAQGFADKRKFAASIACLFYPKASTSSASHDAYAEIKANAGGLCEGPSDRLDTPPRVKKPASSSLTTQRTARVHTKAEDCRNLEDKP